MSETMTAPAKNRTEKRKVPYTNALGRYMLGDEYESRLFMLEVLNGIPFEVQKECPGDEHRKNEGMVIRRMILSTPDVVFTHVPDEVTLLEVIAHLANAMAFMTDSLLTSEIDLRHRYCAEMLENMGVWDKTNEAIKAVGIGELVRIADAGRRVVYRLYGDDGKGSLFPSKTDTKFCVKLRKFVSLWDQMNNYIMENYETY